MNCLLLMKVLKMLMASSYKFFYHTFISLDVTGLLTNTDTSNDLLLSTSMTDSST